MELKCSDCGTFGAARVSEDDHMYMRHPGLQVDHCPDGFVVTKETVYGHELEIACKKCGKKVN
jgi:DNA-directed RNA polymerase subunit RPC12/RpoP